MRNQGKKIYFSELDRMFARIKSRFNNLLFFDQMSPAELKKLNEMWQRRSPKRWDEFTEAEQKALAKEQAQLQRENKREQEWDSIRKFLQRGIDIKSDDPNSELFRTTKELLDIVDRAQKEPLSVSKYEQQKFCTGLDRYKVLLKAELNRQPKEKPAETGGNATAEKIINIENFRGILADDVQAEIVQTGDHSSIHKQTITGEKKKGIIRKILKIIVKVISAIVIGIIVAIVIDILGDFGWLQSIKEFIYNELPK